MNRPKLAVVQRCLNEETFFDFSVVDDFYAKKSGFFQVADVNNVVVVFPRASTGTVTLLPLKSSGACWDWFGTTVEDTTCNVEHTLTELIYNILFTFSVLKDTPQMKVV